MHELSITQNIVAIVSEQAADKRVLSVTLSIGKLSAVEPDSLRFCFDVCCQGTNLEGAVLEIEEIEPIGRCCDCGHEMPLDLLAAICTCGSRNVICIAGEELKIKEMEIA